MKKIILVLLIFISVCFTLFPFGKKEIKDTVTEQTEQNENQRKDFKDTPENQTQVTGLVERGFENKISIVENPSSRSRISYYPDRKSAGKLEKYLGMTVTVKGEITRTDNPYVKNIKITEITE